MTIRITIVAAALYAVTEAVAQPALQPANANIAGRELVGLVRDSAGAAIEGAMIEIRGATARTNDRGAFRLWTGDIDTLTISIRRLGFAPVSALIGTRGQKWDTVVVELEHLPQRLASAHIKAAANRQRLGLRDIEERRARGIGQFVTREEITARNAIHPSDVLREKRGVYFARVRTGWGLRFAHYSQSNPNCIPALWIDGQLAPGMEIDEITATDIEAIELYESWASTPAQFMKGVVLPCGTVAIWTRVPGA